MLKMVFLVHRRSGMEVDEFRRYWRERHASIAAGLPGLRKYIQNHSAASASGIPPVYDGFAEMWWDNADAMEQSLASPEGQAALADVHNFIDVERMQTFSVDEVTIV